MRGVRSLLSWLLALFLMAVLLYLADAKLLGDPAQTNAVFDTIARESGIALFEPTGRYVVGLLEVFAAVLLLLPFTRRFGAFVSFCIAGGAVMFHLSPWLGAEAPVAAGAAETDGGMLFYLALTITAASGLLFFTHPKPRRRR